MAIKVGITGGLGSGKSIISNIIRYLRYPVFDTDSEAKSLMNNSPIIREKLTETFGPSVFQNDKLNKQYVASIIFNDPLALKRINSIVHPVVMNKFSEWEKAQKTKIVFIECAILYESGLENYVDFVLSVSAPEEIRIDRVISRENCKRGQVIERLKSQLPQNEKDNRADFIIYNHKSAILPQIFDLINKISISPIL